MSLWLKLQPLPTVFRTKAKLLDLFFKSHNFAPKSLTSPASSSCIPDILVLMNNLQFLKCVMFSFTVVFVLAIPSAYNAVCKSYLSFKT